MYNPLLDTEIKISSWYDLTEALNSRIERAARKGNRDEAFKLIAEMELYDAETSAYWKMSGYSLISGETQTAVNVLAGMAPQSATRSTSDDTNAIRII